MENPRPVLSVKNVSMEFQVPLEGSSSLKEYLIKLFKGKNSSRTLKALENIWLDVYEGEILGIIGTNGSGKSTLLKIIAGAITPTRGRVVTEEEKIQLLTLGTGFDRELTARENVFLNGALLGYSRSFLKERYPDIVSFAELAPYCVDIEELSILPIAPPTMVFEDVDNTPSPLLSTKLFTKSIFTCPAMFTVLFVILPINPPTVP